MIYPHESGYLLTPALWYALPFDAIAEVEFVLILVSSG